MKSTERFLVFAACGLVLVFAGCIGDAPSDEAGGAYAIAETLSESDVEDVEVMESDRSCECPASSLLDPDCDYLYYPAAQVCIPSDAVLSSASGRAFYDDGRVENSHDTLTLYLSCAFPTIFENLEGHPPEDLSHVAIYGRRATGAGSYYVDYYGAGLYDETWDQQDDCDLTSTSNYIQAQYCAAEPLGTTQFLSYMWVRIPPISSGRRSYVHGFRICYDPS